MYYEKYYRNSIVFGRSSKFCATKTATPEQLQQVERHVAEMDKELNLSAEQKEKIKVLALERVQQREMNVEEREEAAKRRRAMQAEPKHMMAEREQRKLAHEQHIEELKSILTEEQFQKLQESKKLKTKHKEKPSRQKHHRQGRRM
ncbi:hypothetical protein GGR32_001719 [Mesonia hippocampi]|uniref:Uncharacterized protein n=1 Tax=Mesonia hippocampi TaxID=1628250 RepID=A0A840EQV1_9FLAO|nr:hypothetical protein [Mesonia hippocampi]MBB4119421.1 hypothetical protein [Mesonia hippocampi]